MPLSRAEINRRYRERHPEKTREANRRRNARRRATAEGRAAAVQQSWRTRLRSYGWTPELYAQRLAEQGGACAICGKLPPDGVRLCADHNHTTGAPRALLCRGCNTRVGWEECDSNHRRAVRDYIERWT